MADVFELLMAGNVKAMPEAVSNGMVFISVS
jgi:hypothetical protein